MDYDRLHGWTFDALDACLVLLTFVLIERLIYHATIALAARRSLRALASGTAPAGHAINIFESAIAEYLSFQRDGLESRARVEDLSAALLLRAEARLNARLWILDTIVTAAPLLGLLGTIFGIMQTFGALSAGGISDPAAVSRGIGMALQATALGIGTALYGLVAHNALHRQSDHLSDLFKIALLRATKSTVSSKE